MSESGKTKRTARPARRVSKPPRDARAEEAPPVRTEPPVRPEGIRRAPAATAANVVPTRLAALQAEVARLTRERAGEADDMAAMLVRVADSERARTTAVTLATQLEARVEGLESELAMLRAGTAEQQGRLDEARRAREALEQELRGVKDAAVIAQERAVKAEQAAYGNADALARTRAELEGQIARASELETRMLRAETSHSDAIESAELEHATALEALRREHLASVEALRAEHATVLAGLRGEHATAQDALRREHAAALEAAQREHEAQARSIEDRLSAELASVRERHAAELSKVADEHAAAARALEARHAAVLTSLREEHATARRTASYALEEERSGSARLRQQVTAHETHLAALRASIDRATKALVDQGRLDEEASAQRGRSLKDALDALGEDMPTKPPAPSPKAAPRPAPSTPESKGAAAALDEIDIDLSD